MLRSAADTAANPDGRASKQAVLIDGMVHSKLDGQFSCEAARLEVQN
jgi:hypothetical protein